MRRKSRCCEHYNPGLTIQSGLYEPLLQVKKALTCSCWHVKWSLVSLLCSYACCVQICLCMWVFRWCSCGWTDKVTFLEPFSNNFICKQFFFPGFVFSLHAVFQGIHMSLNVKPDILSYIIIYNFLNRKRQHFLLNLVSTNVMTVLHKLESFFFLPGIACFVRK